MKYPPLLVALTMPLFPHFVHAVESVTILDPVIVTASRSSEPESQSLAAVTVIERADIERQQARSVPDVLRSIPGISLSQNGGDGQLTTLFLRGTNSDHTLILIDGVRVGSATAGLTPLENVPLAQVERIEVVRGPRSSLYGSEAIGGVIQIFTKKGGGPLTPRFSLGAGTLGSSTVAAGVSGGGERGWFDVGANLERSTGINACSGRPEPFAGCGVIEPDHDGYRQLGVNLRAGYAFSDAVKFDTHLLRSDNHADYDGSSFAGNVARAEQQTAGTSVTLKPLELWTLTVSAGQSWDHLRALTTTTAPKTVVSTFDTTRDTLALQNDLALTPTQKLSLGVDYLDDQIASSTNYHVTSRDNLGIFSAYQGQFGATELKLSARQDDNQQFGQHATGSAAVGYRFANDVQLALSYGTAFKAPSFNNLYYPNYGNPALNPEQARNWEVSVTGKLPLGEAAAGRWDVRLYQTEIDDLITFDPRTWTAANINRARIRGVEATAAARLGEWDVTTNLTLMNPEDRSVGSNQGKVLARRPEQTAQLALDRQFNRWSVGTTLLIAGRRFDDPANAVRLGSYTLVDLRTEYALSAAWRLQLRLENALNEHYETSAFYHQPARAAYLTLRYAL
ncbi:TonB-dependent vitamin B12 receptor [Chromatium okenii]|uniref:TonB-dependent vitamin B12 receptor n=1 Tax=Chromatium okenii TaxID=61644 RepID=A0A2S7XTQ8_9GAMM|nr:TonB-dependent vitamin B12 receptor [Chromatium okenii]PQJ97036.1 TonB-dependent vitamin B12 receptor [Chromatium okenii]